MGSVLDWSRWKEKVRALRREAHILSSAARDPRVPWYARVLILGAVAYAISPIDLIPDVIPVLGQLDDLVIVPAALALAIRMIPPEVLAEHRAAYSKTHG